MSPVLLIAKDEWRYWLRSNLAVYSALLFLLLLVVTSVITVSEIHSKAQHLEHDQNQAEEAFVDQPARHPHRMVHYGHYVFRTPLPLSLFDPGLDAVTGKAIFLEGHRQNSATFSDSAASAELGGLAWLTPAVVYQLFAPLLIILLGHGAIARERESATLMPMLAQGLGGRTLLLGKSLALLAAICVLLIPMVIAMGIAVANGALFSASISLLAIYFIYLCIWGVLTLWASSLMQSRATGLASLVSAWLLFSLVMPAALINWVAKQHPMPGKIETDMAMLEEARKLGDGHNANDPAFAQLRAQLLEQYDVENVEDLPVNVRGIVAQYGEEKLTKTLNEYAQQQAAGEARQAQLLQNMSWLSPTVALGLASRAMAGTDLHHYQLFLKAAEQLRFDFVQGLNKLHAEEVTYNDDVNKYGSAEQQARARVDASNWRLLDEFEFHPQGTSARWGQSTVTLAVLVVWLLGLTSAMFFQAGRLQR
ncbi:DUF3526 domain-containing protein [Halioxenophilus aromaticivorans]|uniref:DUF3526 domain-containing protein n=1 Tax=Halioxenophilus aromaticivorans TaxID=1306992 RepID=A0AAV3U9D5_9ALTE